ncbi:MAG: hypothetical protein HXY46_16325 [Syntrophaceae bacterium]|nr:hypothetical protein [Syntrophaceae bacterium]
MRCRIGFMGLTDMVSGPHIIHPPVCIHSTVSHFTVLSLAQDVADFRGVEAVAGSLVAGEGFVDGKESLAWGPSMKLGGSISEG